MIVILGLLTTVVSAVSLIISAMAFHHADACDRSWRLELDRIHREYTRMVTLLEEEEEAKPCRD